MIRPRRVNFHSDLNIHVDGNDDNDVKKFLYQLYVLGLTQRVTSTTNDQDHIPDLIITRTEVACVTGIDYDCLLPSHHCSIHFTTTFTKPRYETVVRSSRKIRLANINVSASMIESVLPAMDPLGSDASRLGKEYYIKMKTVIDKVEPFVT